MSGICGLSKVEIEISDIFSAIHNDQRIAATQIGWLRSVNPQQMAETVDQSIGGHALWVAEYSIWQSVVMFIERSLENNGCSLSRLAKLFDENRGLIVDRHLSGRADFPFPRPSTVDHDRAFPSFSSCIDGQINAFVGNIVELADNEKRRALQVIRNAHFGHRLGRSKSEQKQLAANVVETRVSSADTTKIASRILSETRFANLLWTGGGWDIEGRDKKAESACRVFWNSLPVLADVEKDT